MDALQKQFEDAKVVFEENASLLNEAITIASEGVSEGITQLFAGDPKAAEDAIKKTFSSIFGVMVQALTKEIDAVVLKTVLDWLGYDPKSPSLPFLVKVALIPVMTGIISGAVNAIASPILNGLLSFSSGGRIDSPTMALIGDASRLGGSNREWVTRDKQLQQIVGMGANMANAELLNEMRALRQMLGSQKLETVLKGTDIYISQKRTGYDINQRSR
jgi:hypothetical protein